MQKAMVQLPEIKLVGITTRTSNLEIFKSEPGTNKIAVTAQKYFQEGLASKMNARKNRGTTFCVYTKYKSDFTGEYTYFIGEAVNDFVDVSEDFETLIIPTQDYAKFTNQPGPMPKVCIDMWQDIWKMDAADLGGERTYIADFEIYDERSIDQNNTVLDIYIGIKK